MPNIKVNLIAYSANPDGRRIATFEWEYPRFVHSEIMTHRALSKNAASSRAIPANKVRKQVWNHPVMPHEWSKNQPGMQAKETLSKVKTSLCAFLWRSASKMACIAHYGLEKLGLHKQYVNRILEPWTMIKIVITGTEWNNFIWLRDDEAAQPELQVIAKEVKRLLKDTTPKQLKWGEWHLPYVEDFDSTALPVAETMDTSVSCCAQVSYRTLDTSPEKAKRIVSMLKSSNKVHASPFEHQAQASDQDFTSMNVASIKGFTHRDTQGQWWSGNLCGWLQHRQLIAGHVKKG